LIEEEPSISEEAVAVIEKAKKPLPAAVREWYSLDGIVPLHPGEKRPGARDFLLRHYSNADRPVPLEGVLAGFAKPERRRRFVRIIIENQGCARWFIE